MAALRNRNGKWQAQVSIKGHALRTQSFTSKRDAERWARQAEAEPEASVLGIDNRVLDRTTVRDLACEARLSIGEQAPRQLSTSVMGWHHSREDHAADIWPVPG